MKKLSIIFFTVIAFHLTSNAQKSLKLGDNTGSISSSAILELDASLHPGGLLLPRVTLTGLSDVSTIASPSTGLIVYNTGGSLAAGLYIFDGTVWNRLTYSLTGTAISSLNGLTGATQTFVPGTSGTDFNIVPSGTTHTFNIPSASASNRGLLLGTDWAIFNNKQDALTGSGFVKSLAGVISYDNSSYQPLNTNLTSIGGLTNAAGILRNNGSGTFTYDNSVLSSNQAIIVTATGDATGTSTSSGTSPSIPLTLASVNANVGTFGTSTSVPSISVNAKGLVTSATETPIPIANTTTTGLISSVDWNTFNTKGTGSVTSVAATVPSFLSITGSPITTNGTLAIDYSGTALPIVNGGTGAITAPAAITNLGAAPIASPTFTGTPTLPTGSIAVTQTQGNNSTAIATTAYADAAVSAVNTNLALKANIASPTFTGTPTLPTGSIAVTQTQGNNSTAIATTAYADAAVSAVNTNLALKANILSPIFTGTPTAPTPALNDNTTNIATTAFVNSAITNAAPTLTSLGAVASNALIPAGTATKITYDAKGLVVSGTTLASTDIPNNAANTSGTAASLSTVLSSTLGGAGAVSGLLKANGSGTVTQAVASDITSLIGASTFEPIINAGTIFQYWRGDKTWQTLNTNAVTEGTNLYYTNARTINAPLTGYLAGAGAVTATDNILQAIQKLDGNIASKQNVLTTGSLTEATSSVLTITGGVNSIIGAGTSIEVKKATGAIDGYLSSIDWTTFNGKQSAYPNLTLIGGLANSAGVLRNNGTGTFSYDNSTYLTSVDLGTTQATGTLAAGRFPALTGDVSTSAGSLTTLISPNVVTYAKMQTMTPNKILGSGLSGTAVSEITLGTGLSFTGSTLNSTGGTVSSVSQLNLGTTGTDLTSSVANGTTTPVITLNVPTASATNRGALSAADWTNFNTAYTNRVLSGLFSARPVAGTAGRIYYATDNGISYFDNSASWAIMHGALNGDVTTSVGSLATTISSNAVTYGKMQAMTTNKLLGSGTGTAVSEITLGTGLSFSGSTLNTSLSGLGLNSTNILVGNASNIATPVGITGDVTLSNTGVVNLVTSGVTAGTYGSATQVPVITVDPKGRITNAVNTLITGLVNPMTTRGDIIYGGAVAAGVAAPTRLAANGSVNTVLHSGLTGGTAPSWGLVTLTTDVTGVLPTANGGTALNSFTSGGAMYATSSSVLTTGTLPVTAGGSGNNTLTANSVLLGNGNSAISNVGLPGSTGLVLTSVLGGPPIWQSVTSSSSTTNLAGGTAGVVPYQSGVGTTSFTSVGTSGQFLLSGGTGNPTWGSATTLGPLVVSGSANYIPRFSSPSPTTLIISGIQDNGTNIIITPSELPTSTIATGIVTNNSTSGNLGTLIGSSPFGQSLLYINNTKGWQSLTPLIVATPTYAYNSSGATAVIINNTNFTNIFAADGVTLLALNTVVPFNNSYTGGQNPSLSVTLPAASSNAGKHLFIRPVDNITQISGFTPITPIDVNIGQATRTGDPIHLMSDGSNWYVLDAR